jgi:hypothetical protein
MGRRFKAGAVPMPAGMRAWPKYKRPEAHEIRYAAEVVRRHSHELNVHQWFDFVIEMGWLIGADKGAFKKRWLEEVHKHGGWRYGTKPACGCDPVTGEGCEQGIPMFCHRVSVYAPGVLKCSRCESTWRIPEGLQWEQEEPGDNPFWMTGCSYSSKEHALDCAHCQEWD